MQREMSFEQIATTADLESRGHVAARELPQETVNQITLEIHISE
jgi:hypothetical protein